MKTKLPTVLLFTLPLAAFAATLEQKAPPTPPPDAANPLLVWDVDPSLRDGMPRSFRTTSDPLKPKAGQSAPSAAGLADLHASGSSEFTAASLKLMLPKFHGPVTIFDLRQEDHGFVNGEPISWFATNNWANVGKTHAAIVADEKARLAAFTPGEKIALADDKVKKGGADVTAPENVTVAQVQTEAQLAAADGVSYVRVTVSDHSRPTDAEVDRFVEGVRAMPADGWAHFHCRAGKGRTTTFLALYDMLRNSNRASLDDIVARQSLLGGDYDLFKPDDTADGKAGGFADRAAFVRAFYNYSRDNPGGQPKLWSEWLKAQP